ncbi:MAG: 30S ribosomal protein S3 [Parcubacteria group bacterium]|nr:30S ribosomal protein S3 [Parcubacteria group bacterium]
MGHKVHPKIYRIPSLYLWDSKWFAKKGKMPAILEQELKIRDYLENKLKEASIDAIGIERTPKEMVINILAGKPGVIIGRGGQSLEILRKHIEKNILQFKLKTKINVQEVRQPALSAKIVAQSIVSEIERRFPFRRVMKQSIERVMSAGALGVKVCLAGRLNGVEIARTEKLSAGKMSLITIRSDVDYAFVEAHTIYGKIGVKVWIYKGEAFSRRDKFAKGKKQKNTRTHKHKNTQT